MRGKSIWRNLKKEQVNEIVAQVKSEVAERHRLQDEEMAAERKFLTGQIIDRMHQAGYSMLDIIRYHIPDIEEPDAVFH